jgi:hypothetical protein
MVKNSQPWHQNIFFVFDPAFTIKAQIETNAIYFMLFNTGAVLKPAFAPSTQEIFVCLI